MQRARVVIVGGGIAGASVAYHLARAGWTDVLLLEKGELTSGSTHHAAGLVTQFNPAPAMLRFRRYSVALYEELGVFAAVGSVRIASSRDALLDLRRAVSRVAALGLAVDELTPDEVAARLPGATADGIHGGIWIAGDGHVDPHIATHAVADAARALGVEVRRGTRLTAIELDGDRAVRAVQTDAGPIETQHVVNAAGIWAPQVAALAGVAVPSVPVDHQHAVLQARLPRDGPCFRDPEHLVYGRPEAGGMLIGGYEPEPVARWADGVPWRHGASPVESDMDRFAPLLEGAIRRFPFLEHAGVMRLLCHPDAMTPDGNPLLGPVPGVRGFWLAAGLSLNGFGAAGGLGKSLAEQMTSGETEWDVSAYRPSRFGAVYRDTAFAAEKAREVYRYYYRLRYPLDSSVWGRGHRLSPLHGRLAELGAVFGEAAGWERAEYFEPGEPARRAGEDQRGFGFAPPPYLERLEEEYAAATQAVAIADLTSARDDGGVTIALLGPRAADVLAAASLDHTTVATTGAGPALDVAPEWAVQVWDRLMSAGAAHGIRPVGQRTLDALEVERGAHGLRTLVVGEGYACVYGGEAVRRDGVVAGRVERAAYAGGRTIVLAAVDGDGPLTVDVLGEPVAASG
jgi:4-methylaminobutanoate oxidase (formaldehyde-forming)